MEDDVVPRTLAELLDKANDKSLLAIKKKAISLLDGQPCTEHNQPVLFSLPEKGG